MKKGKKNKNNNNIENSRPVKDILDLWETSIELDATDVNGSYTGRPYDAFEESDYQPVQDADDL